MAAGRHVFEILRTHRQPAVEPALLAVLQAGDMSVATPVVQTLLARGTKAALQVLVRSFHLLPGALAQTVLADGDRLFGVLRETMQSRDQQVRINVLEIIRRACLYRAAYLVDGALHDRMMEVRRAAAKTLHSLADELLRTSATLPIPPDRVLEPAEILERTLALESHVEDVRQVVAAIEAGLASFDLHQQGVVIEAAMWLVDELSTSFLSMLFAPGARASQAALELLKGPLNPRLVPFAFIALSYAEFRAIISAALAEGGDPEFLACWLRQCWRTLQPRVARSMACLKDLGWARNHGLELCQAPGDAQRMAPRWLTVTGLGDRVKADLLRDLQQQGGASARRSAVWALMSIQDARATAALRRIRDEGEADVATLARRELARRCRLGLAGACEGSAVEAIQRNPAESFEAYLALFDELSADERAGAARRLAAAGQDLVRAAAIKLADSDPLVRGRAMRVVNALGITAGCAEHIYPLCQDADTQVRSAALATLAKLPNATSRQILGRALNDQDARAQANAVEALGEVPDERTTAQLLPKLDSTDNRVRANAVQALLKMGVRQAAETLLRMLQEGTPMQRISALWLIERMGLLVLADRVVDMAKADPDQQVRERASSLARQLTPAGGPPASTKGPGPPLGTLAVEAGR